VLSIDHLQLRLPAGFEQRAESIARLVADALARLDVDAPLALERVALRPIELPRHASDADVALRVAGAVHHHLSAVARGGES
jgi:hypothetical protein